MKCLVRNRSTFKQLSFSSPFLKKLKKEKNRELLVEALPGMASSCRSKRDYSQFGIRQEGYVREPIWISFQPGLQSQSKPTRPIWGTTIEWLESLDNLHFPCPQFTTEQTISAMPHKPLTLDQKCKPSDCRNRIAK